MKEFCDLNVVESASFAVNLSNVKQLIMLGYTTVAIHRPNVAIEKRDMKNVRTCPPDSEIQSMKQLLTKIREELDKMKDSPEYDFQIPANFKLLSRISFQLTNQDQITYLRASYYKDLISGFDLISMYPGTTHVFKTLMDGKIEVDIITLQLEEKQEYKFTKEIMGQGIAKGYVFEICYAPVIKSVSWRKSIFHNARLLVQKTNRGEGIILSSAGDNIMDFRSPHDVANLAELFNLKGPSCFDAVGKNSQKAVVHSQTRKETFKGCFILEEITEDDPCAKRIKI